MKRLTSLLTTAGVICSLCAGLTGCGSSNETAAGGVNATASDTAETAGATAAPENKPAAPLPESPVKKIKIGLICLHDETSPYDQNFISSLDKVKGELGMSDNQIVIQRNIPESDICKETAKELAANGCDIIFADSFGHEPYLLEAAKEYPNVQFCHATGTLAHTEKLPNFHDAFAAIYQGRYLAGIAGGMKINEMIETGKITADQAVIGYVGSYSYAEVISGYTAFYLGAKSVCPSVTMKVQFTGSWYDEAAERDAAQTLIDQGCILISQHADSMGAPSVCEEKGVPNISYNGSTTDKCPNTFIVSSKINWAPYFEYVINMTIYGDKLDYDWVGTLSTNSVQLTPLNYGVAAEGTKEALDAASEKLGEGTLHVFDTSTFTVEGKTLSSYMADVDTDDAYTPDTEVISDGYFHESEYRSAPYFNLNIDGITQLNTKF